MAAQQIGLRVRAGRNPETQAAAAEELAAIMADADAAPQKFGGVGDGDGQKTYAIAEAPALTKKEIGIYWAAWNRVEKACPGVDRHALTRCIIGSNKAHQELTREEWRKLISAFTQIAEKGMPP